MSNLSLKEKLTSQQLAMVQGELEQKKKSTMVAYLFLFFFVGQFGAHRFYVGKTGSALILLILGLLGYFTPFFSIGIFILIPVWIWIFIDIFLLRGFVKQANEGIERELIAQVINKA